MKLLFSIILFAMTPALAAAQTPPARSQERAEDFVLERRAAAEQAVVVTLCISSGNVNVRGWDRAEVRARSEENGSLRLLTPNVQPAPRVEVLVAEEGDDDLTSGHCGSATGVELMVPRGATVNLEVRDGHVEVADVAAARIKALSGDVNVRRVSKSVDVSCLSGDITLGDSSGDARLQTMSGSVEARNVRRNAAGDELEAKSTSGDVTIERATHSQVTGGTVSGSVLYTGAVERGGVYDFKTMSGDVTLELPADASFRLHAKVVVSGDIITDFPVKIQGGASSAASVGGSPGAPSGPPATASAGTPMPPAPPTPPHGKRQTKVKPPKPPKTPTETTLDGTVGTGDAVVNLTSFSGTLWVRKR